MQNDPPSAPPAEHDLRAEAAMTVSGVLDDLAEVMTLLTAPEPASAEDTRKTARILGRLAEEITEAAGMLHRSMLPAER